MILDSTEAITNAVVGLIVSYLFLLYVLPLWGLQPTAGQAWELTAAFFFISTARAFVLRRLFRRIG